MDLLMEWVTQIIIFVLVASMIDLFVPSTAMKKYIKLVVGLIFILIFLKPVFHLFQIDIEHALQSSFSHIQLEDYGNSMENLIKNQKREIQASNDAYILEQMTIQLKEVAKEPLEKHQVDIVDIHYEFLANEDISYDNLEEVIVFVQPLDKEEGDVTIVEEVIIDTKSTLEEKPEKDSYQIQQDLIKVWELSDKDVTIKWGGGAS
ncbi:MAG TPA: stage III sporulation protein AF [Virgibacillus sp.]|nr:stage III sporulation protein AF [Virgibacillus sp.]